MKDDMNRHEEQLSRLADALVDDILNTPDDEILQEAEDEFGDHETANRHIDAIIVRAKAQAGKERMAAAREGMKTARAKRRPQFQLTLTQKRQVLDIVASSNENLRRFTRAARNGKELAEKDLDATLQSLFELGVIDEFGQLR